MSLNQFQQGELDAVETAITAILARPVPHSEAVVAALRSVPRSAFAPPDTSLERLYNLDCGVVLETGSNGVPVSSLTCLGYVAEMLEMALIQHGQRVLEIGTASGFNAMLLRRLVGADGQVVTVEIDGELASWARTMLGDNAVVVQSDGYTDLGDLGSFDRILVSVAAPSIPALWLDRLQTGGCLIAVVQGPGACFLLRGWKDAAGGLTVDRFIHFGGWNKMIVAGERAQPWFGHDAEHPPIALDDTLDSLRHWFGGELRDSDIGVVPKNNACMLELPQPLPQSCFRSDLRQDPQCHLLWVLSRLSGVAWRLTFVCVRSNDPCDRDLRHLRWVQCYGATAELVYKSGQRLRSVDRGDTVRVELTRAMDVWQRCTGGTNASLVGRVDRGGVVDAHRPDEWCFVGATTTLRLRVQRGEE